MRSQQPWEATARSPGIRSRPAFSPSPSRPLTLVQLRQGAEILVVSFRAEDVGQQNLPEPKSKSKSERMTAEDPEISGP